MTATELPGVQAPHDPPIQTGLHEKAAALLNAINVLTRRHGLPPTVRQVQQHTGISSPSVAVYHLTTLVEHGLLVHVPGDSRAYRLPTAPPIRDARQAARERYLAAIDELLVAGDALGYDAARLMGDVGYYREAAAPAAPWRHTSGPVAAFWQARGEEEIRR